MHDSHHVAVLDFGSQYTQLIVRRVRELGYFAKLYAIEDFPDIGKPGAIILSGGPKSTGEADAPDLDFEALKAFNVPVLGVCYGMHAYIAACSNNTICAGRSSARIIRISGNA